MNIICTWGNEQPNDRQSARVSLDDVFCMEYKAALTTLYDELNTYSNVAREMGIKDPYKEEKDIIAFLRNYVNEGYCDLQYLHLRYIKAGILLRVQHIVKKRDELSKERFIPQRILDAVDKEINRLATLAEHGVLKNLRPTEVFFELDPVIQGQ